MPPTRAQTIKGIVFDKDGTLFDFHKTWTFAAQEAASLASGVIGNWLKYSLRPVDMIFPRAGSCRNPSLQPVTPGNWLSYGLLWARYCPGRLCKPV